LFRSYSWLKKPNFFVFCQKVVYVGKYWDLRKKVLAVTGLWSTQRTIVNVSPLSPQQLIRWRSLVLEQPLHSVGYSISLCYRRDWIDFLQRRNKLTTSCFRFNVIVRLLIDAALSYCGDCTLHTCIVLNCNCSTTSFISLHHDRWKTIAWLRQNTMYNANRYI
jgi:hypothetical protein